jgi:hypothetical protein
VAKALLKFRVYLKCKDKGEFEKNDKERFEGEFFVPTLKTGEPNEPAEVHLVFANGEVGIERRSVLMRFEKRDGKRGAVLQFSGPEEKVTKKKSLFVKAAAGATTEFETLDATRMSEASKEIADVIRGDERSAVAGNQQKAGDAPRKKAPAENDFGGLIDDEMGGDDSSASSAKSKTVGTANEEAGKPKTFAATVKRNQEDENTPPPDESAATVSTSPTKKVKTRKSQRATAPKEAVTADLIEETTPPPSDETPPTVAARAAPSSKQSRQIAIGIVLACAAALVIFIMTKSETTKAEKPTPQTEVSEAKELAEKLDKALQVADQLAASGELTGPDSALEQLLSARKLDPDNPEVLRRLESMANKFEQLANSAEEAENLAEAAAHLQAALLAAPERRKLSDRLRTITDRVLKGQAP